MEDEPKQPVNVPAQQGISNIEVDEKSIELDHIEENSSVLKKPSGRLSRLKFWYLNNKKLSIPLSLILLLIILFIVPFTRYSIGGLAVKRSETLTIKDSKTNLPVSGAKVSVDSVNVISDGNGRAVLPRLSAGHHKIVIAKTYYQDQTLDILVPIMTPKAQPGLQLVATGRQVKISVRNLISKKPVAGAQIVIGDIRSQTDASGSALVVVPADSDSEQALISAKGFNDANSTISVSDTQVKDNSVNLTPAGQIYFLSKASGKIDVVKTNLDGTSRKTVLAGTGREDDRGTVLLASRDWQYLALISTRDGSQKIYIINTDDDSLLTMDQGDSDFTAVGWHDHYFVYTLGHHNYNPWQPNAFSIKSYNADNGKILTLANTNATGSSNSDAEYENIYDTQLFGNDVVFSRTWYKYPGYVQVDGKQDALAAVHPDGSSARQLKVIDASDSYISNVNLVKPRQLAFSVYTNSSSQTDYFTLDKNSNVNQSSEIKQLSEPVTYLQSPSGNQTFWQEQRDGKSTLLIGDQDAANSQVIASLADMNVYGWYTDNYLLASKNSSELYILPVSGISSDKDLVKVTDYHKPALDFYGYGGGYGGL